MKLRLTFTGVFLLAFTFAVTAQEYLRMIDAGTYPVQEVIDSAQAYFSTHSKERGSGYKQFKRWEYNALRMVREDGYLPTVQENLVEFERYNAYLNQTSDSREVLNDNWEELGPDYWNATTSWNPGVGRVTGIAIDPNDNNTIIIGANTGGVWKTTDGGGSWTPLNDFFSNLYVYAVTIDPNNSDVYYFGSYSGLIFKSEDAGATWDLLADISNSLINKIVVHPDDPDILFACSQNAGIYSSTDGGNSWSNTGIDNRAYDVEYKPGDPSVVYASGNGFHKSTDGGATFTTIPGFDNAPKMIGVSADDPEIVYVVEADGGTFGGFYSSSDSGDSFSQLDHGTNNYFGYSTAADDNVGQAPRDMDIAVNPNDANEVHIAGILTWRSTDGGVSFTCTADWVPGSAQNANIGYCHADVDIMLFNGSTLWVGTDGGIFKADNTADINTNYYTDLTTGIGIRQWYRIGISQTPDVLVTGGSQDNGSSFYTQAEGWKDWIGADGMEGFVHKDNTDILFGTIQFGRMYRTEDAGATIINLQEPGQGSGQWVTPFEKDPVEANTIYVGYNRIHKSTSKGASWTVISQDFGGDLDHLKIAPSDNQVMYASDGATLFKTEDGGATNWQIMSSPGGSINAIAIHPTDPQKLAVVTTSSSKVLVSEDGGESWTNLRGSLPDFSALAIAWHDNSADGLYVGMDYGLFYRDDTMDDWVPYNNSLPNVIVNELEINLEDGKIYAGTYGRGLWASDLFQPTLSIENASFLEDLSVVPNPASGVVKVQSGVLEQAELRIFNTNGQLLRYEREWDFSRTLDITGLSPALYFVRLNTEKGVSTLKLIVR